MNSQAEENYLKAIYKLSDMASVGLTVKTNAIAAAMNTSAASVTDMLIRLAAKDLVYYKSHKGAMLTSTGQQIATDLIRAHRLWEVFLVEHLGFAWDECHDLAEQLEHVQSAQLVTHLDNFLGNPKFDPHGDPIPDAAGNFTFRSQILLSQFAVGECGVMVGVNDHSSAFLKYLDRSQLNLDAMVEVLEFFEYDNSMKININGQNIFVISEKVSQNIFLEKSAV